MPAIDHFAANGPGAVAVVAIVAVGAYAAFFAWNAAQQPPPAYIAADLDTAKPSRVLVDCLIARVGGLHLNTMAHEHGPTTYLGDAGLMGAGHIEVRIVDAGQTRHVALRANAATPAQRTRLETCLRQR